MVEAHEVRAEGEVNPVATASVVEGVVEESVHSNHDDEGCDQGGCGCEDNDNRVEVNAKRDMPKFQVVAIKNGKPVFWTFDGRRELDTALAENDYDEILKIYRGKEVPFKMRKAITLA